MKWIGHTEFGANYIPIHNQNLKYNNHFEINHWIEQWYLTYSNILQLIKNKRNIYPISYEKLYSDSHYRFQIQKIVRVQNLNDFQFKESKKSFH